MMMVRISLRILALLAVLAALPARADDLRFLDWGRIFTNDALGDGQDRWRTGSNMAGLMFGEAWAGQLPARPGRLLEFRLRAEIVAPESLTAPAPGDRRYAGVIGLGLHTHYATGGYEVALGADLNIIGPQTRLDRLQAGFHDIFGMPGPAPAVALGLPDDIRGSVTVELARPIAIGSWVTLRPFVEGQAGVEDMIRAGGDVVIGSAWTGAAMLRDPVTGQRFAGISGTGGGFSVSVGGDVAHVGASALLPDGGAAVLRDDRARLRMGLAWQGPKAAAFTGLTWLSPEFADQDEGQLLGSLSFDFRF